MSLPQSEDQLRQLAVDEVGMRLLRAAEIIRERGWCQKVHEDADRRLCAMGAIWEAFPGDEWEFKADPVEDRLRAYLKTSGHVSISEWNDDPNRTADEVLSALTAAAFRTGE